MPKSITHPASTLTQSKPYQTLLAEVRKVFIEGLKRIEEEKVKAYWRTGQLISDFILKNQARAEYGENVLERLSEDLNIHVTTLRRTVQFYHAFPIRDARRELTWSHYRALITIPDEAKRRALEKKAIQKEWDHRRLQQVIQLERLTLDVSPKKPTKSPAKLSGNRAKLFTYKILEPTYIHPVDERLVIDVGFHFLIHAEIKGLRLKTGDFIESQKKNGAYHFKRSCAAAKDLYTYKALVERVVDGDTLMLNVDLGFDCWVREKVRLRGIDTPELSTKEGDLAKRFVEGRLKQVNFVVVKTHKDDKYGRYVSDIFYLNAEDDPRKVLEKGVFLNQELLDNKLAVVF